MIWRGRARAFGPGQLPVSTGSCRRLPSAAEGGEAGEAGPKARLGPPKEAGGRYAAGGGLRPEAAKGGQAAFGRLLDSNSQWDHWDRRSQGPIGRRPRSGYTTQPNGSIGTRDLPVMAGVFYSDRN